jgi:hypothetical protein
MRAAITHRSASRRRAFGETVILLFALALGAHRVDAEQIVIDGPERSGSFGTTVTLLPNGNFVVTDPLYDTPNFITDVGAVYLYSASGTRLSALYGSTAGDRVGNRGIVVLSNGNFVIRSSFWSNGASTAVGAVTFGTMTAGANGTVSAANSLIGSSAGDVLAEFDVVALSSGNYLVICPFCDIDGVVNVGAVAFGSGRTGLVGEVRATNALVGSTAEDRVGVTGIRLLANGDYLVRSALWDNGSAVNAGAVTFGSGTTGVTGVLAASNSLVGSASFDAVGQAFITVLANGSYVVSTRAWDSGPIVDAGAVTFGTANGGVSGAISAVNSLVGSSNNDQVGGFEVFSLANSNYVVRVPDWDRGTIINAGAVTFGSGVTGVSGEISPTNSLVGSSANDKVGSGIPVALSNGNYVVCSQQWSFSGISGVGAATFASGVTGLSGEVSPSNSLVGSSAVDNVCGGGIRELANGNYLVMSPVWDNGVAVDGGAVTWASGTTGIVGAVSAANSLVGGNANDRVGLVNVFPLSNGNYVIGTWTWDNAGAVDAGAATFGPGATGISGFVSPANSLVGSSANDRVGQNIAVLTNGNYVVSSPNWDHGIVADVGAATFGSGTVGVVGAVSTTNSLVGSTSDDRVGNNIVPLRNGNYVVVSSLWNNGAVVDAGAVTFSDGSVGTTGSISVANSLVGGSANDNLGSNGTSTTLSGEYLVNSPEWDNAGATNAGAVTRGSGTVGVHGVVSESNSLVGVSPGDRVGDSAAWFLNGTYAVRTPSWDNGAAANAGALTYAPPGTNVVGAISPANSLVGTATDDNVGQFSTVFGDGNLVVRSPQWDNGVLQNAGAVTLALADGSVVGTISAQHGVLGQVPGGGSAQVAAYDNARNQLIVGMPVENRVVLHRPGLATTTTIISDSPDPSVNGQLVTLVARVLATSNNTIDGRVTFRATSGETCVDTIPDVISAQLAEFSCSTEFTVNGQSMVTAEFSDSTLHSYSASQPEPHTANIAPSIFANGFE